MSQNFYTQENLKVLVNISKKYLKDKYDFEVEDEKLLRKFTFDLMGEVNEECKGQNVAIDKKNVAVLNGIKELYVKRHRLSPIARKPNVESLNRDRDIFGNRPVNANAMVPEIDPYVKKPQENKDITRIMSDRDNEPFAQKPLPDVTKVIPPTKEVAEDNDSFMKKLKDFEMQREKDFERQEIDRETREMLASDKHEPKSIYMMPKVTENPVFEPAQKEKTINEKSMQSRVLEKYVNINSQDRVWWLDDPFRYKYAVHFASRFRNIEGISIGKVIIPDEIIQLSEPVKTSFNYDFTMAFPYLVLKFEEFNDIYDGSNDVVRNGFCKLVFHKAYKGQNGRGYVILKPEQKEKKYFYPAPLGALNKLSVSLLKPSGQILNRSVDHYKVLKIEFDAGKPKMLKVTTNVFFDKNELYVGDTVLFKNYVMTRESLAQTTQDINAFNEYVNRLEGHDIMEGGAANGNGYYDTFFIEAPGKFDAATGDFVVSSNLINCLNDYNAALVGSNTNGNIMNLSLQNSISMKLDIIVDDAKILDTQRVFNF